MLPMRLQKPAPLTVAASSSSTEICIMFDEPERLAKGKCFTMDTSSISRNVPYSEGMSPPNLGWLNMEK